MRRLLISALLLCSAPVSAQHLAPEDYIFPLRDVAGLYSANFGEMRPNHFHSGIDIKTDGVTGKPVLATADGYISRIAVTPGGYGRAIYITHPNGTTSVYGHLSKFRDDIEKYVHEERYRTRRNSINLYPSADRFPLKQGEQFAWSGNTGSSAGPHLHFEIRDSRTQRTLNTISSGVIRTRDDIPPRLVKLYYVEVDSVRGVPVHARPRPVELVEKTPGRYALKQEGALSVGGRGYFILEATDRKNDVSNTFGLWRIREFADEDPIFELRIDGFAFDQTRYCNAVTHYPMQVASRNEVIRLTRLDGCIDDFYPVLKNQALLTPSEGQSQQIRIEAEDDSGNRSILEFRTIRQPAQRDFRAVCDSTALIVDNRRPFSHTAGEASVHIPAGVFYEPLFFSQSSRPAQFAAAPSVAVLSPLYSILDYDTPLHTAATVTIRAYVPQNLQPHTTLGFVRKGKVSYAEKRRRHPFDPHIGRLLRGGRHRSATHRAPLQSRRADQNAQHHLPPARQLLRHRQLYGHTRRGVDPARTQSDAGHHYPHLRRLPHPERPELHAPTDRHGQLWQQNRLETDDNPITIPIFTYFRHCPQHSDGRPENRPELFSDNALPDYTAPFIFGPWRILSQARHTMTTKDPLNSYCLADLSSFFSSDSGAVRTLDPQLRRLLLYPTELRNQRLQHIIA